MDRCCDGIGGEREIRINDKLPDVQHAGYLKLRFFCFVPAAALIVHDDLGGLDQLRRVGHARAGGLLPIHHRPGRFRGGAPAARRGR